MADFYLAVDLPFSASLSEKFSCRLLFVYPSLKVNNNVANVH